MPPLFSRRLTASQNWARLISCSAGVLFALFALTPGFAPAFGWAPFGPVGRAVSVMYAMLLIQLACFSISTDDATMLRNTHLASCVVSLVEIPLFGDAAKPALIATLATTAAFAASFGGLFE